EVEDQDGGIGSDEIEVVVTNTTSGLLVVDENWSGKEMIVTGDVLVPSGITLTIEPGSEVQFEQGVGLIVEGTLTCQGLKENQIILRARSEDYIADLSWDGVKVSQIGSVSSFSDLMVMGAERGLTLVEQIVNLSDVRFENNRIGLHIVGGNLKVMDSIFYDNAHYGIKEDKGAAPIVLRCGFGKNRRADYYDELLTWISVEKLNSFLENEGNYEVEGE
ncbi:MAG: hypothetical protein KAX49_12320, partial [Halanaerobiales bacterium]|nr:hypothetical protein [Halanaerobiales bacterium]